jgi:hypothetical protein
MNRLKTVSLSLALAMIVPMQSSGESAPSRAAAFTLKDQFGRELAVRYPRKKVSVLTFGDWKGSGQIEGWVRPIWNRYRSALDLHGIAVLDIVPEFAHDLARDQFRQRVKYPVLLDFTGNVAKAHGFSSDNANILVIAPDGAIALRIVGAASSAGLRKVYDAIERLGVAAVR